MNIFCQAADFSRITYIGCDQ